MVQLSFGKLCMETEKKRRENNIKAEWSYIILNLCIQSDQSFLFQWSARLTILLYSATGS